MKKILLSLLLLLAMTLPSYADETNINFRDELGSSTISNIPEKTFNGFKFTPAKGTGSSAPAYNRDGDYRLYAKNTLKITSANGNMKKIVFTCSGTGNTYDLKSDSGTHSKNGSAYTWEGDAESVTFTMASSGQFRAKSVAITTSAGGDTDQDPQLEWHRYIDAQNSDVAFTELTVDLNDANPATDNTWVTSKADPTYTFNGEWAYTSSNQAVAEIDNGMVTLKSAGTTTITAGYAGDGRYKAGSCSYELTVTNNNPAVAPELPVFSIAEGEYYYGTPVTITSKGATSVTYLLTYDKSTGKADDEVTVEGNSATFTLKDDVEVLAYGTNTAGDSDFLEGLFYVKAPDAPTFNPAAGEVEKGTTVTITANGASKISYMVMTPDQSDFISDEDVITMGNTATYIVTQPCLINVTAFGAESDNTGVVAEAIYSIAKPKAPAAPVFDKADGSTVAKGTTVGVSAIGAEKIYLYEYAVDGEKTEPVEIAGAAATVTVDALHRRFVAYAENEGGISPETEVFYQSPAPAQGNGEFRIVTDASTLAAGDVIAIACTGEAFNFGAKAISTQVNKNNRKTVSVDYSDGVLSNTGGDYEFMTFELGGKEGAWTFKTINYGQDAQGYLGATSTGSNYLTVNAAYQDNGRMNASITINAEGKAVIKFNGGSNYRSYMLLNSNGGSPLISCYDSSDKGTGYAALSIFKKMGGEGAAAGDYDLKLMYSVEVPAGVAHMVPATNKEAAFVENADGTYTHSATVEGNMSGSFYLTNADGTIVLGGHPDSATDFSHEPGEECEGDHSSYVYAEHNKAVKLKVDGVEMSTHPNVHHGVKNVYNNPTLNITFKPFYTAELTASAPIVTGVEGVAVDAAAGENQWYDMRGIRVNGDNLPAGLYIRRNGKTVEKVVVK